MGVGLSGWGVLLENKAKILNSIKHISVLFLAMGEVTSGYLRNTLMQSISDIHKYLFKLQTIHRHPLRKTSQVL